MDRRTADIINEWGDEWGFEPKQAPTHVGERFVRFMSMDEYCKFMDGWTLRNERDHSKHADTNSVGFCFVRVKDNETCHDAVLRAAEYLYGIASDYIALAFENVSTCLSDCYGVYADPYDDDWFATVIYDEYSAREYGNDTMRLLETFPYPTCKTF